jgi:DNA-binding CsgD family transcriptional regulator
VSAFFLTYWVIAYTSGVACATALALRFIRERKSPCLLLLAFTLCVGCAVLSLALRDITKGLFPPSGRDAAAWGRLALTCAGLCAALFPAFAESLSGRKRRASRAFIPLGLALAALNDLPPFTHGALALLPGYGGIITLIFALTYGFTLFIKQPAPDNSNEESRAWMIAFCALTAAFIGLDLFGLLGLWVPAARGRFFVFPGLYALLNVFLFRSFAMKGMRPQAGGSGAKALGNAPAVSVALGTAAPDDAAIAAGIHDSLDRAARLAFLARYGISAREEEVLRLLAEGKTYQEMADALCLSMATVKSHMTHLYDKTGTRNKVELLNLRNAHSR